MNIPELLNVLAAIPGRNVQLTPQQEAVIRHPDGPAWVLAGPGSGKTEVLTILLLRLLYVENDPVQAAMMPPESIFITTFTEKAAKNLEDRLSFYRLHIIQAYPQLADVDISKLRIGTLHGLCNDLLQEYRAPNYQNVRLMDEFEQALFVYQNLSIVANDDQVRDPGFWTHFQYLFTPREWQPGRNHLPNKWSKTVAMVQLFNRIVDDRVDVRAMRQAAGQWQRLADLYEEYIDLLARHFRCDFSQLQLRFLDFLGSPLGVNYLQGGDPPDYQGIRHVLVDEYQDTNLVQETIYMTLAGAAPHNLVVVGDDDQAMYRFRGGSVECMVSFDQACQAYLGIMPGVIQTYPMATNFRSHPDIVQFCNDFVTGFPQMAQPGARVPNKPNLVAGGGINGNWPAVATLHGRTADDLAQRFAGCVRGLVDNNIVNDPSECCLLLRSTRETSNNALKYVEALRNVGLIPYNPRNRAFFEQEETLGILGALIAILDPNHARLPPRPQEIGALVNSATQEFNRLAPLHQDLQNYVRTARNRFAAAQPGAFLDANLQEIFFYLMALPPFDQWQQDPERRIRMAKFTNLLESYASMPVPKHPNVSRGTLRLSRHDPGEIIGAWLQQFYYQFVGYITRRGLDDVEDDEVICPLGRVPIMTMHQSKGLEFPFVFVGHANSAANTGSAHELEDAFAAFPINPARVFARPAQTVRAELDLIRQYFVAYSRAKYAVVLLHHGTQMSQGRIPCGATRTWMRNHSLPL